MGVSFDGRGKKMKVLFIEGRREGSSPEQCGGTMAVGDLIEWLDQFDYDTPVYLSNDKGYTYGSLTESSFEEREADEDYDEDEDQEEDEEEEYYE